MMTSRLVLVLMLCASSACGADSAADTRLDADAAPTSDISMSLAALESMSLPDGTAVIVPLDSSVLALDADALAEIASNGSLEDLLDEFILTDPLADTDVADGAVLRTSGGLEFSISVEGDTTSIGAGRLIDVRKHDGLTILVADGLFES